MTLANGLRLWFIVIWGLSIVGSLAAIVQFFRGRQETIEQQVGPLPTPMTIFNFILPLILLAGIGQIAAGTSAGWLIVRLLGLGLSIYGLVLLPWTVRTLDRFGIPGVAILRDHELVTSGPFRLVRHPGYSAYVALWLGTALATLNWLLLALWPLGVAGAFLSSRAEEKLLRQEFGTRYDEYAEQRNRFIPGLW